MRALLCGSRASFSRSGHKPLVKQVEWVE
uniref:Uncharacterized protein n=1 Tax=Vitis vinifera TaxID=29760 RepID=F6HCP8_VITVI